VTGQVASLKRQLEFSQMQVSELQQANADARCRSESQPVDVNDQQRLSEQSLQVRQFTCVIFQSRCSTHLTSIGNSTNDAHMPVCFLLI